MKPVEKATEIKNARIQFVSLVDKAANKRTFLLRKADGGKAAFQTYGRIIKADPESHYVTGIVYEPMVEDAHGDFMSEDEITKAAYRFTKSGNKIDLQHSFEPMPGASVVESWIAKTDFDLDGESVRKGTWLMTVEITDAAVWDAIEKGDITGFSMGGVGDYSTEDTDLSAIDKGTGGLFKRLAAALGYDVVEKGAFSEIYEQRLQSEQFWSAFTVLQDILDPCGRRGYETDESKIREALSEFGDTITALLTNKTPFAKSLLEARPVEKTGKSLSSKNKETLRGIYDTLGTFLDSFEEPTQGDPADDGDTSGDDAAKTDQNTVTKEEDQMTKQEAETAIQEAVQKAMNAGNGTDGQVPIQKGETPAEPEITAESIQKMVEDAIEKANQPKEEHVTAEEVQQMIAKAIDPLLKSRGIASNLNHETGSDVKKSEPHYLHGIL